MANAFVTNFAIPSTTNVFQLLWKLTRTMKAAGWVTTASSDGYTRNTTGTPGTSQTASTAASSDTWGDNASPLSDTYPPTVPANTHLSDTVIAWIVMSGPKTVKIPLNANPTGTFIRGESITQATSSATGELLGYVWDTVGLTGYAAVLPRTGTFDNSHTVTGSLSGATFVPTGTVVVYGREIMFSKSPASSITGGQIYYICADVVAEASQFFSAIAAATVLPTTTIAAGSDGVLVTSGTIIAQTSTVVFPSQGSLLVTTTNGPQFVQYTGNNGTSFTGCTGGSGTMHTSGAISALSSVAPGALNSIIGTLTSGSTGGSGSSLPIPNIAINDVRGFPTSGSVNINIFGSPQTITYTGITGTSSGSFTGCSGGNNTTPLTTSMQIGTFPTKAICVKGAQGAPFTGTPWFTATTGFVATGNGQIACVNATPSAGVSADGSFYAIASNTATATTVCGLMFTRLDDTDPGDIDPYAFYTNISQSTISFSNQNSISSGANAYISLGTMIGANPILGQFIGYCARGCPVTSRDLPTIWGGSLYANSIAGTHTIISGGIANPTRVVNHPAATAPTIREPLLLWNNGLTIVIVNTIKQIKGKTRWIQIVSGTVVPSDTFDGKTWIAVTTSATSVPGILFGPYDGATTPVL